jgi:hypothetical protein
MHYVKKIIERHTTARKNKANFTDEFNEIIRFIRPRGTFFDHKVEQGYNRESQIYDSTGIWALRQFASAMYAYNVSDTVRWFTFRSQNREIQKDPDFLSWVEEVSDIIYEEYQRPEVGFAQMADEVFMDIGAFGTGVPYQEYDRDAGHLQFRAFSLGECDLLENFRGLFDHVFRSMQYTTMQIIEEFGEENVPAKLLKSSDEHLHTVIHAVLPNNERTFEEYTNKFQGKKYASCWFIEGYSGANKPEECVLKCSGFDYFPYHPARWSKVAGETFGRGQGALALDDVRMLQALRLMTIKAAELAINPPIACVDGSVTGDHTLNSGDLVFVDPAFAFGNGDPLKPVYIAGDPRIGRDMINDVREQVLQAFFVDQFIRPKKKERQTAVEISDDRSEGLRQLSPMIARIQKEFTSPCLMTSFKLLYKNKRLPELPLGVKLDDLSVYYTSPAAKAQRMVKVEAFLQFLQITAQTAQFDQEAPMIVKGAEMLKEIAMEMEVPRTAIATELELQAAKDQQAAQQQALMQSQVQEQQSNATLNMAKARNEMVG